MENFTARIESLLNEKLSLYREMNDLLKEEQDLIVKIDVDSLWKTAEKKRVVSEQIQDIRQKLLDIIEAKFNIQDLDAASFSLSYYVRKLPVPNDLKYRIKQMKIAIDAEKNEIAQTAKDNKKYVQDYLLVIDDIMSVFADSSKQAQYRQSGTMAGTKRSNCLIHAEV